MTQNQSEGTGMGVQEMRVVDVEWFTVLFTGGSGSQCKKLRYHWSNVQRCRQNSEDLTC